MDLLYAVTGGAGFIGSHLCDALLAAGHSVRVLDDLSSGLRSRLDPRCELLVGDVADPATVRRLLSGAEGCFHLAGIASVAKSNQDWIATHRVNLTGTVTVLDEARAAGRLPVVYASSAAVYGDLGHNIAREDAMCAPRTAYGADKLGGELHARAGYLVHGVPSVGLRLFNVYGPRQDPASSYSGVISIFADRLAHGQAITLHGDGLQCRDFVHVQDAVAYMVTSMHYVRQRRCATVVNVCTGSGVTVRDLADLMARSLGVPLRIVTALSRDGDIRYSVGDPSRAMAELGACTRVALADGIGGILDDVLRLAAMQVTERRTASHTGFAR